MKQHTLTVEIHTGKKNSHLVDDLIDQLARAACDIANSSEEGVHLYVRDAPSAMQPLTSGKAKSKCDIPT